ncbi:MAG: orotidine-5'-phosphate decarboxylase [Pyrinomonadaceae bacterium]
MTDTRRALEQLSVPGEKLIVALDLNSAEAARRIVGELAGLVDTFKIGLQLFTAAGGTFVRELVNGGSRIFLDLKFHDIPNTVAMAGIEAARLGVWMFNVHAGGGGEMMRRTIGDVGEFCSGSNLPLPRITGVTVLTSSNAESLFEVGLEQTVDDQVVRLAKLTAESGLHGVVSSPNEAARIRGAVEDPNFLIVTPGVRPLFATNDDQKRVMTPREAISNGSNYLVIGRPIVAAPDPHFETTRILEEINAPRQ